MSATLLQSDARTVLRRLPEGIVRTCITSPPYFGLRDYKSPPLIWGGDPVCAHEWGTPLPGFHPGQVEQTKWKSADAAGSGGNTERGAFCTICGAWRGSLGLEPTPALYVEHLVEIMRGVRRVLADDGTLWLNLGDSYASNNGGNRNDLFGTLNQNADTDSRTQVHRGKGGNQHRPLPPGLKTKDLIGIPWMVAFALRDDGWWLRMDIVWAKGTSGQKALAEQIAQAARDCGLAEQMIPCLVEQLDLYVGNPMPESVKDRPARAHEYLFLLSKSKTYFYDADAVREPEAAASTVRYKYAAEDGRINKGGAYREAARGEDEHGMENANALARTKNPAVPKDGLRNRRSVWTISTKSYKGAHFATYPPALVEPCVLAGSEEGDLVLDPFCGSGTTGEVALKHGRSFLGIDLSSAYLDLARERLGLAR